MFSVLMSADKTRRGAYNHARFCSVCFRPWTGTMAENQNDNALRLQAMQDKVTDAGNEVRALKVSGDTLRESKR